jgi:hypothetical protein
MTRTSSLVLLGAAALTVVAAIAAPQSADKKAPAAQPQGQQGKDHPLPPGMTEADMQACIEAGTPGEMHAFLAEGIGTWSGDSTCWMTPQAEPLKSKCTLTTTAMLDGRFTRCEVTQEIPGMGTYNGFGISGFDNVGQTFQSTWVDNHKTGMMIGTGELSADGSTLTWNYEFNCPITKQPAVMREVCKRTGKDAMTLEMFGTDPKSGAEFKMMEIAFMRKAGTSPVGSAR